MQVDSQNIKEIKEGEGEVKSESKVEHQNIGKDKDSNRNSSQELDDVRKIMKMR